MKMSINKAIRLTTDIEGAINPAVMKIIDLRSVELFYNVNSAEKNDEAVVDARIALKNEVDAFEQLLEVRQRVRRAIQQRNENAGINDIISKISQTNLFVKTFKSGHFRIDSHKNYEEFQRRQEALGITETSTVDLNPYNSRLSETVNVETEELSIQSLLLEKRRELRALEDKRNELNARNDVEILDDDLKFLTERKII